MTETPRDLDPTLESDAAARFSLGGMRVFTHLQQVLDDTGIDQSRAATVIDNLRDRLLDDPGDTDKAARGLAASIAACRVCDGVVEDPTNGHWNLTDPDLVLVTTTPLKETGGNQLIVSGLKQAGFSSQRVGAISVVRCTPKTASPEDEHINNCSSRYLFTQIQLLQPKLVIAIGAWASSVLLADPKIKVTNHIGEIFWVGPWAIMSTISPSYAAHHPAREEAFTTSFSDAHRFLYNKADAHE